MAFVIPALAAVGGGSAAAGAVVLASAAVGVYTGVQSSRLAKIAGRDAEAQSEIDAAAEEDSAKGREIRRKKNLARAISSQLNQAGGNVAFDEGTPAQIAQLDIDEAEFDRLTDTANSRQRARGRRSQGRAARFAGDTQANITLLDTAAKTATLF